MNYWLVKTEPETYGIDNLISDKTTLWDCVRNYQARNYLKSMQIGDLVLFYHSNAKPPGIAGLAKISKTAVADPTQFKPDSDYYDSKATKENPRWFSPELRIVKKFKTLIPLGDLRQEKKLKNMLLLKQGSRLSVQPVTANEFETILKLDLG